MTILLRLLPYGPASAARRIVLFTLLVLPGIASAAQLDGVAMPDARVSAGVLLRLNGIGVRTYSMFNIHIYVAGLYLQTPDTDADAVLGSEQVKLLDIHFVHDVDASAARDAWSEGFDGNCVAPCRLRPADVKRFLDAVPPFRAGDTSELLFTRAGVDISINGRKIGTVGDQTFARIILATFIGRDPPSPRFRRELLGRP